MKRLLFIAAILMLPVQIRSQDLRLEECIRESLINFPLAANKGLAVRIAEAKKSIIRLAWLPSLDLNGQATWQSDVVTLTLDLPFPVELPKIPRDQYKVTTDISQIIYDGGSIRNQQILEGFSADIAVQEIEVREYELRQMVEELYFAILVTEKKTEVINLMAQSLLQTVHQVESGIKNGILSESDLPVVLSEQIRIEQQLISLNGLKQRAVNTLGVLMGRQLSALTVFMIPETPDVASLSGQRPEFKVFELQANLLDARKAQLISQHLPKIMAFGQAGYGKPGLNFMGDRWDPYLLAGIKGKWNIWDWGKVRQQRETYSLNQKIIANQLESLSRQINQAEQKQMLLIREINDLLSKDTELVGNREQVTRAYESRLNNGLITASQFINEWTREQEARINREVREIELISAEYKLLSIKGKY